MAYYVSNVKSFLFFVVGFLRNYFEILTKIVHAKVLQLAITGFSRHEAQGHVASYHHDYHSRVPQVNIALNSRILKIF